MDQTMLEKTCLIQCIRAIRNVLLNKKNGLIPNIFTESDVCELGVTFMVSARKFSYDIKYDAEKEEYIYESFSEIFKDQYNNESRHCPQERMKIWSQLPWQIPMEKTPGVPVPIARSVGTGMENVLIIRFCWLTTRQKAFFMPSLIWKQSGNTEDGTCWAIPSANRMLMGSCCRKKSKSLL
jgi:hypothetical protein